MNGDLLLDFSIDKENKTINVKREYAAGVALVWDAYTKSEILDQWWAPKPWKARTKSMEFKEGGTWLYAMVGPEGEEHWSVANFSNIVPQRKFTGKDAFTDQTGNINTEMPQSTWEVNFTGKGEKTVVEFNISYDDADQLQETLDMGFEEGLTKAMENLDDLLPSLKNKQVT